MGNNLISRNLKEEQGANLRLRGGKIQTSAPNGNPLTITVNPNNPEKIK